MEVEPVLPGRIEGREDRIAEALRTEAEPTVVADPEIAVGEASSAVREETRSARQVQLPGQCVPGDVHVAGVSRCDRDARVLTRHAAGAIHDAHRTAGGAGSGDACL